MRFDREAWVKLYRAESPAHRLMGVFSRGLRDLLLRFCTEEGVLLPTSKDPHADICRLLAADSHEKKHIRKAIDDLIGVGYLVLGNDGRLVIAKYQEAQEARSPEAVRQARFRELHGKEPRRSIDVDFGSIRRLRHLDGDLCSYCQCQLDFRMGRSPNKATVDHVVPRVHGGSDGEENLVLACSSCNSKKGDRTPEQAGLTLHCTRVSALRSNVTSNVQIEEKRREGEENQRPQRPGVPMGDIRQRCRSALLNEFEARFHEPQRWPEVVEAAGILHQGLGFTGDPKLGQFPRDPGVKRIVELFDAGFTIDEMREAAPKLLEHDFVKRTRRLHALTPGILGEVLSGRPGTEASDVVVTP